MFRNYRSPRIYIAGKTSFLLKGFLGGLLPDFGPTRYGPY